jgi:hypothetical protein
MLWDLFTAEKKVWSLLFGVGGPVLYAAGMDCIFCAVGTRAGSGGMWKLGTDGVYGEGAVLVVPLAVPLTTPGPAPGGRVSSLVMASPVGTLPDPLAFRFLFGAEVPVGDP